MRVTLKRADFYARTLLSMATNMTFDQTIAMSIYDPAFSSSADAPDDRSRLHQEIATARETLIATVDKAMESITACYDIRAQLAAANLESGISKLLTHDKMLAAQEGRLRAMLQSSNEEMAETSAEAAWAKAAAGKLRPGDRYGSDHITVRVLTEADRENYRRLLRRFSNERSALANDLSAANASKMITLSPSTVQALVSADLLPTE